MTTSAEINKQIQLVEEKRRAAERAERDRVEAAERHQRELIAAEAELVNLRHAEKLAQLDELKNANRSLIEAWESERKALLARLDSPDLKLSDLKPALIEGLGNAFNRQQEHAHHIASVASQAAYDSYEQRKAALMAEQGFSAAMAERRLDSAMQIEAGQHFDGLQRALNPHDSLALWVNGAQGETARRQRIAVVFILTGHHLDPNPNFAPAQALPFPRQYM